MRPATGDDPTTPKCHENNDRLPPAGVGGISKGQEVRGRPVYFEAGRNEIAPMATDELVRGPRSSHGGRSADVMRSPNGSQPYTDAAAQRCGNQSDYPGLNTVRFLFCPARRRTTYGRWRCRTSSLSLAEHPKSRYIRRDSSRAGSRRQVGCLPRVLWLDKVSSLFSVASGGSLSDAYLCLSMVRHGKAFPVSLRYFHASV